MKKKQRIIFILSAFFTSFSLYAAFNPLSVSDSAHIRKDLYYTWFTRSLSDLREEKPLLQKNEVGDYFQVSFLEEKDEFAIVCSPVIDTLFLDKEQGTWILYRDKKTEAPVRIEFYFTNNPEVFLVIKPYLNKTSIDIRVFNTYLIKDLSFSLAFKDFYALSFSQFFNLSKNLIPWNYFTPEEKSFDANIQIISQLRDFEELIVFRPNSVYDENGQEAKIFNEERLEPIDLEIIDLETKDIENSLYLSSMGYVKWIVDGLIYPQVGSYLKIEPLKKSTIDIGSRSRIESLSQRESVYASLDWTRNLATAFASIQLGRDLEFFDSGTEVNRSFFALSYDSLGDIKDSSHIEGSGYPAHILKPLLFMLALTEPERMYIAAIKEFPIENEGEKIDIGHFRDALVFLPYFDQKMEFQCSVFYAGKEISLEDLIENSKKDYFSLVRIKTNVRFFPLKKE